MPNLLYTCSWRCSRAALTIFGLTALAASSGAWAGAPIGGTITHGPLSATAVPTTGGFALILLAALMLVAVARVIKSRQLNGGQFMLAALVTGAIASGASGIKLVSEAHALRLLPNAVSLSDPAGGTLNLVQNLNCVSNETGVAQQILDIQINVPVANNGGQANGGAPTCPDGPITNGGSFVAVPECSDNPPTVLQPDGTCAVDISLTSNDQLPLG
ncbi:midcut-by-XrtH protein [Haliea sp. E1-2-M8]|uniref:midcut-by-XrtH protein n=1 Tax=Haliea sp. E1-2-M8 TaxID=3064706 RepID=UPI0027277F74|nr:midcut-by-XrtH protein [Haliea sp. E1-2-M8]MDO8862778.1 midcut-by-XrtH protein [Haliea sp. E1-2-M8]